MAAQLMTCSDSLAHRTVCRLYGQLLVTKPLDSFCLYLVLSPSWLWVSFGLRNALFPDLGRHSLHPQRDKGHNRLSVFITHQNAVSLSCGCPVGGCGVYTDIEGWTTFRFSHCVLVPYVLKKGATKQCNVEMFQ